MARPCPARASAAPAACLLPPAGEVLVSRTSLPTACLLALALADPARAAPAPSFLTGVKGPPAPPRAPPGPAGAPARGGVVRRRPPPRRHLAEPVRVR